MSKEKVSYGLGVSGIIRVFSKSKDVESKENKKVYTIVDHWFNVSEKNDDDETWFNKSMKIIFKRGINTPDHNTTIKITGGRFMISGKDKYRQITLYVPEWESMEEGF